MGIWSTGCIDAGPEFNGSLLGRIEIQESSTVISQTRFSSNCTEGVLTRVVQGQLIPQERSAGFLFRVGSIKITVHQKWYVNWLNRRGYCERSDWEVHQPKEVTGLLCFGNLPQPSVNDLLLFSLTLDPVLGVLTPQDLSGHFSIAYPHSPITIGF